MDTGSQRGSSPRRALRKTCDPCRRRKIRCSGETPCERCQRLGLSCRYSQTRPIGRPPRRRGAPTLNLDTRSSSYSLSSNAVHPSDLSEEEHFHFPENFDDSMAFDILAADSPVAILPAKELSWSEMTALEGAPPLVRRPADGSFAADPITISDPVQLDLPGLTHHTCSGTESTTCNTESSSSLRCECGELVRQHLNNKGGSAEELSEFLNTQRRSMEVAKQVLNCPICCDTNGPPSEAAGNVLLFGAVMTDIASSYQSFIRDQRRRALAAPGERSPTKVFLGSHSSEAHLVEVQLERQKSWQIWKIVLRGEVDQTLNTCRLFVARQVRLHENGHEMCGASRTCKKTQSVSQPSSPANFCPRSVEPTTFFNCFRTSKLLHSLFESIQWDLDEPDEPSADKNEVRHGMAL